MNETVSPAQTDRSGELIVAAGTASTLTVMGAGSLEQPDAFDTRAVTVWPSDSVVLAQVGSLPGPWTATPSRKNS